MWFGCVCFASFVIIAWYCCTEMSSYQSISYLILSLISVLLKAWPLLKGWKNNWMSTCVNKYPLNISWWETIAVWRNWNWNVNKTNPVLLSALRMISMWQLWCKSLLGTLGKSLHLKLSAMILLLPTLAKCSCGKQMPEHASGNLAV